MLRRPARYLNEREAGDGEFSPVPVPAGIQGINTCATSGGSLRDTANPNALSIKRYYSAATRGGAASKETVTAGSFRLWR